MMAACSKTNPGFYWFDCVGGRGKGKLSGATPTLDYGAPSRQVVRRFLSQNRQALGVRPG